MTGRKGLLIILSGPSGVGKGTIRKIVMKDRSLHLSFSISMTTRSPRNKEKEGKDYYFVTKEHFMECLKNDELLEHAQFVGNYYGTPKQKVEDLRSKGRNVILEIEVNGATQVMEKLKDEPGIISIFLVPPSLEELRERIVHRCTETEDIINMRMEKAKKEMKLTSNYDYVVVNDEPLKAANKIKSIIRRNYKKLNHIRREAKK